MTVHERIEAIVGHDWPIAYDGCHKLYFLPTSEHVAEAVGMGYGIYQAGELPDLYHNSCSLKFISQWGLDRLGNDGFDHDLNVRQFEGNEGKDEDEDYGE